MSDHLVVFVDRLIRPVAVQSAAESSEIAGSGPVGGGADGGPVLAPVTAPNAAGPGPSSSATDEKEDEGLGEEEPLIQTAECRICQEEDSLKDLETPCACSGSLQVKIFFFFFSFPSFCCCNCVEFLFNLSLFSFFGVIL